MISHVDQSVHYAHIFMLSAYLRDSVPIRTQSKAHFTERYSAWFRHSWPTLMPSFCLLPTFTKHSSVGRFFKLTFTKIIYSSPSTDPVELCLPSGDHTPPHKSTLADLVELSLTTPDWLYSLVLLTIQDHQNYSIKKVTKLIRNYSVQVTNTKHTGKKFWVSLLTQIHLPHTKFHVFWCVPWHRYCWPFTVISKQQKGWGVKVGRVDSWGRVVERRKSTVAVNLERVLSELVCGTNMQ